MPAYIAELLSLVTVDVNQNYLTKHVYMCKHEQVLLELNNNNNQKYVFVIWYGLFI